MLSMQEWDEAAFAILSATEPSKIECEMLFDCFNGYHLNMR